MAEIVKEGQWKQEPPKRRGKIPNYTPSSMGKMGNATACLKFKAADTKVPFFISNVHKDTLEKDIADHVFKMTNEIIHLQKIQMRNIKKKHNAYKFYVPKEKMALFLSADLWPRGVIFRKFLAYIPPEERILRGE